jgi:hypothetical protein
MGVLGHLSGLIPPEILAALEAALASPEAAAGMPSLGGIAGMFPKEVVAALSKEIAATSDGTPVTSLAPLVGMMSVNGWISLVG